MTVAEMIKTRQKSKEVRCSCSKRLGDWDGDRLIIRRLGLILQGGHHTWTCTDCGTVNELDLANTLTALYG